MKNNQGVTLVELIVVILIIGVLSVGGMYGIKSIDSGNVQAAVERVSALLDYVRGENMSKATVYYLVLEEDSGAYYANVETESEGVRERILQEKLKLKNGIITYQNSVGNVYTIDSDASPSVKLELSYDKESGSINQFGGSDIENIVFSSSGRIYTLHLVSITGKHYID